MITDTKTAEAMIRRDLKAMADRRGQLVQQRDMINQQIQELTAAINGWTAVVADDPAPPSGE